MVELSPTVVVVVMFGAVLVTALSGYPLFICLGAIGLIVGYLSFGPGVIELVRTRTLEMLTNYVLLAVPLFIFMGSTLARSGLAEKLYDGLQVWFGGIRGGLAVVTVMMGVVLAACVGVIVASVSMLALVAMPGMMKHGYNKELACGCTCAGGTLGILIPPSVMLVVYGPMAEISVGQLFMGAFIPGLLLATLYTVYILVVCFLRPSLAPSIPASERSMPLWAKTKLLVFGIVPPLFIILSVLGVIFFGVASPTEAAAIGCIASIALAAGYRRLTLEALKQFLLESVRITAMGLMLGASAYIFVGVFLRLEGGEAVAALLAGTGLGKWGVFVLIMFILFILGMFIDWLGILFVMVPVVTPIGAAYGFDPLWFGMMICVNLQMSFLTPPFAYAIFYLKGLSPPEWGVETKHIIRGVLPFVGLIMTGLFVLIIFPELITWLPHLMIR